MVGSSAHAAVPGMLEVMVGSLLPDQTKRVVFRLHCPSGEPGTSILLGVSAGGTLPDSANSVEYNIRAAARAPNRILQRAPMHLDGIGCPAF